MQLEELKGKIKIGQLDNHYIFIGPDYGLMRHYINEIVAKSGYKLKFLETINDIKANNDKGALFKQHYVYVVSGDESIFDSEVQKSYLRDGITQGNNIAILIYYSKDIKKIKEDDEKLNVIKFNKQSLPILRRYLKRRIDIKDVYADFIIKQVCEFDISRINTEIDRINSISGAYNISLDEAFEKGYTENVFHINEKLEIFELINDILRKDWPKALHKIELLKESKEGPFGFIALLYNQFKGIYLMKLADNAGKKATAENTGLEKYQIAVALNYKNNFSLREVNRVLNICRFLDQAGKTGEVESHDIIDLIMSQFDR